jgi:energy-coupling factor transporter transmembrane protein EcfT
MIKLGTSGRPRELLLVEVSPLRRVDPRTKLALALLASLAVMLPLGKIIPAVLIYALLLFWSRLLNEAARQVWRLKWVLMVLFVVDWLFVGLELGVIIILRLILLAGAFTLFFATTTPAELRLALEWLRVPHRYAFSLSLAFQSLGLLDDEWRTIVEAQRARGAWSPSEMGRLGEAGALSIQERVRRLVSRMRDLVSLTVPVIVLTTKRAWAMTEAAYARGFDSPQRRPFHGLAMGRLDWVLLTVGIASTVLLVLWR